MAEQMKQEAAGKTIPAGYKQTEVGVIPEDWSVYDLPDVIWYQEGPGLRKWQFQPKGLKVINVTNLQDDGFLDLDKTERHISWDEFEKTYKHFMCDAGDLVIASSGNSYCKSSTVRECDLPLLMNTSVIRFKPINDFSKGYMDIYLRSQSFKEKIDLLITGGAQPNFGPAHLNKIKIPAPTDYYEQTAIANVLSDSDALIGALEQLIAKKQAIKSGTMQQLLTGRTRLPAFALRPDGTKKGYKPSELGDIPEDWVVAQLGEIVKLNMGQSPSSSNYNNKGIGMPLIQGNADILNRKTIIRNYTSQITKKAKKGDLILSVRAPVGEVAKAEFDCCIGRGVCAVQYKNDYLYQWLVSFETAWDKFSKGSTFDSINSEELRHIELIMPSDEEQTAIATILSDMDNELQALTQKLEKARALKQGMMQQLLTGKIRLPLAAGA
ncbi:restriction endonuclease subunit S [Aeromonas salmonicida]|uniref:restriction endonuclease subunit S n=1 Tax=Aeromonas salmonicida TaxID=645 RepID=UPI001F1656EB|nr:restriction endonuclease subunit S [Aeromonas salmonicida]MCE9933817.1 restriction endonuclease subunit S [Aeromonas salmonicida]